MDWRRGKHGWCSALLVMAGVLLGGCASPTLTKRVVELPDGQGPRLEIAPAVPCAFGRQGPSTVEVVVANVSPEWTVDRTWVLERSDGTLVRRFFGIKLEGKVAGQVSLTTNETPPLTPGEYRLRVAVRGRDGEQTLESKLTLRECE